MKRILALSFLSAMCLLSIRAQTQSELKLTPHLRMLLSGNPSQAEEARKVLTIKAGPQRLSPAVGVFVKFQGDADLLRAAFASLGASIHTVVGNLATAEIPIAALRAIAGLPSVVRIEESKPVEHTSDVSVPATGANQIWFGSGGPVAFTDRNRGAMPPPWGGNTGQNAIVGIVDSGIDLNHKDFLDATGATRILSLWDNTATKGTPPASPQGFPAFMGNECTSQQINALHANTDLVIAESFDEMMGVLLGGAGFGGPSTFSKGHSSVAVAAADFDRDGNMDVVSGNLDGTISWVQGNGHGGFVPQAPTVVVNNNQVQITSVATGDFNQDGFPDVVALLNNTNQAAILLGNGDGTFQPAIFLDTGNSPSAVAVADLDGDGIPDIVVGNYNDGTISVFVGIGDGTFASIGAFPISTLTPVPPNLTTGIGTFPSYIAIGDFNGDGIPDLAIASFGRSVGNVNGSNVSIMLGVGNGAFGTPTSIYTGYFEMSIALGDFNGDGKLDIALQSYSVSVTVLLGNGDGTFGPKKDYNAGGNVGFYSGQAALVVGDFNGDGILDIANLVRSNTASTSDHFYDGVGLLLGNGDGTFGTATVYPTGSTGNATYLVAGDFHASVCTEVDLNGHGTTIAGIAAGNGSAGGPGPLQTRYRYIGMAPQAPMIVVKTMVNTQDVVDSVAYIANKATALAKPVAINLSLGTSTGPHDGTSIYETMLSGLAGPGIVVVAATGNNGNTSQHADGVLPNGGSATLQLSVPAPGIFSTMELDLWYPGQDQFGVNIIDPNGNRCMTSAVYPGDGSVLDFQNPACGPGTVYAYDVNPDNGDHEVDIFLNNNPLTPGTWSITLTGSGCGADVCVTKGSFDLYTNRWCVTQTSCTALTGNYVDAFKSITVPATATNLIAVGSYVTKTSWIGWGTDLITPTQSTQGGTLGATSLFSGIGPRRTCSAPICADLVQKPDVVAPGENIFAPYAANTPTNVCGVAAGACLDPDAQHIGAAGTSEATPHVTGAVALLLSKYGKLSPCQVKQSLTLARTDANTGLTPNPNYGFGKLAIDLSISQQPVQNVVVPNVVGLTLPVAEAALLTGSLFPSGETYAGSGTVPVGSVISETPGAGVPWCGGVELVVSGIAVPNVAGQSQAGASATITGATLTPRTFTPTESLTVPPGDAIQTSPPAGTFVAPNSPVDFFISGIKVPVVTSISKAAALAAVSAAGLIAGNITFAASQAVQAGNVISEDPAAGTVVLPQTPVNLVVSGIPVPNVVGLALTVGEAAITGGNLTVGNLLVLSSGTTPVGDIISEIPSAGTYVDVASPVTLIVSGATVPAEVGQAVNAAEAAIIAAGLTVGNVSQAVSPVVPVGQVMNQNPGGGSVVLPGTTVDLVVSSGSLGQLTVPNVAGLSQANAATAIANAGLVVGVVTMANSATVAAGLVISESPVAGTGANPGSAVNIVVSLGPLAQSLSIAVTPANPSIAAGTSLQFVATGNGTQNLTNQVTWAATGVATITANGLATTHAIGGSTISAAFGGITGSTLLTAANPGKCDINHDGLQTVSDVQGSINQALGVSPPGLDLNGDGVINIADVQIVVIATLGQGCPQQ